MNSDRPSGGNAAPPRAPQQPAPAAPDSWGMGEALKLVKAVRDRVNVQLKVFRMNDLDMVAALTRDQAMDWYHKNTDRETSPPVKELGLHTTVIIPEGEFPLWYLVADHFRRVLSTWQGGPRLPDELLAPFLIFTAHVAAPETEGGVD